jgi:hypothetical protein
VRLPREFPNRAESGRSSQATFLVHLLREGPYSRAWHWVATTGRLSLNATKGGLPKAKVFGGKDNDTISEGSDNDLLTGSRAPTSEEKINLADVFRAATSHGRVTSTTDHRRGGDQGFDHHQSNGCGGCQGIVPLTRFLVRQTKAAFGAETR